LGGCPGRAKRPVPPKKPPPPAKAPPPPRMVALECEPNSYRSLVVAPPIDSPCACEHNNPDSLDARLFPLVVLVVAPAATMDEATSLLRG